MGDAGATELLTGQGGRLSSPGTPAVTPSLPEQLVVAEAQPTVPELTTGTIRNIESDTLVRLLAEKIDQGWVPTLAEAKTLVCRGVEIAETNVIFEDHEELMRKYSLPWPPDAVSTARFYSDGKDMLSEFRDVIAKSKIAGEIKRDEDDREVLFVIQHLTSRMPQKDIAELGVFILDNLKSMSMHSFDLQCPLIQLMKSGFDQGSEEAGVFCDRLNKFFFTQVLTDRVIDSDIKLEMERHDLFTFLYRGLLRDSRLSTEERMQRVGQIIRTHHTEVSVGLRRLPDQINAFRRIYRERDRIPREEAQRLDAVLRSLLGLGDKAPIHPVLNALYTAIRFEEYPVSKASEKIKVSQIAGLLRKYGVRQHHQILELGSGTGWFTGGMREHLYANIRGLDISERNLEKARQTFGDHFILGTWYEIPVRFRGSRVILSIGRDLPHTEHEDNFRSVLRQVKERLDADGVFIFDMPDPTRGAYRGGVKEMREIVKRLGFTEAEVKNLWFIVDSPDGINCYNRYVPPPREVVEMLLEEGFKVEELLAEPIPNGKKDWNITFVARKKVRENLGDDREWKKISARRKAIAKSVEKAFSLGEEPPGEFKP